MDTRTAHRFAPAILAPVLLLGPMNQRGCENVLARIFGPIVERCREQVVNIFEDRRGTNCFGGPCSLYDAVRFANACNGTVRLPAGNYVLDRVAATLDEPNALPIITGAVTILGEDAVIWRGRNSDFRFFYVSPSGSLTLHGVTLLNGGGNAFRNPISRGAAIFNLGTLTLRNSTLSENVAFDAGGAIYNLGTLLVAEGSRFERNVAGHAGGAILNGNAAGRRAVLKTGAELEPAITVTHATFGENIATRGSAISNSGHLSIEDSTFDRNQAGSGGGTIGTSGTLRILGSTFSRNTATGDASAILMLSGTTSVTSSTLSHNSIAIGKGEPAIRVDDGSFTLIDSTLFDNSPSALNVLNVSMAQVRNSIIVSPGNACSVSRQATFGTVGANIASDPSCGFSLIGDPGLGPLTDNGGPTETHALEGESQAIDGGTMCEATDQRGLSRPSPPGGRCDIGAFEVQVPVTESPRP